jgi:hypothetical protein
VGETTNNLLSTNMLSTNLLSTNLLSTNALATAELTGNSLSDGSLEDNSAVKEALYDPAAREVFSYIYACAASQGHTMSISIEGTNYNFNGALGLADSWRSGSCDATCQGWVSACVLARSNYYGQSVHLSLRGSHANLGTSAQEVADYPNQEGKFYGNLFTTNAQKFSCAGPQSTANSLRRCTETGSPNACDFTGVGSCSSCTGSNCPSNFGQVITVYLE